MKIKFISVLCVLLLAAGLNGCGKSAPTQATEAPATQATEAPTQATEAPATQAAEDPAAQAMQAYRELLKAAPAIEGEPEQLQDASFGYEQNQALFGSHYDLFALSDLNQDGIPELIALSIINRSWTPVSVFTYADGNVVLLKDPADVGAHGTFEQCSTAGGAYFTYLCEENHIHSVWRGMTPIGEVEENYAYELNGAALAAVECTAPESEKTTNFYDIAKHNTAENADALTR